MKLLKVLVFGALLTFATAAFAEDEEPISPNGGSDQCGLAWKIVKGKTLMGTLTRMTTNYYFEPSFSMTSGTSGCEKHKIAQGEVESVKYVAANFNSIKSDMAEGQGEYLAGLGRLMGCSDQGMESFQNSAQQNFGTLTQGADAFQVLQNVKGMIRSNGQLSASCSTTI